MKKFLSFVFSALLLISASAHVYAGAFEELSGKSGRKVSAPAVSAPKARAVPQSGLSAGSAVSQNTATADWLVMVYIAGMNDLGLLGMAEKNVNDMEQAFYNWKDSAPSNVKVVVEYAAIFKDNNHNLVMPDGTKTLLIGPDDNENEIKSKAISTSRNINTGDPRSLENFVRRVKSRFPAKHTMLIIWNHGGGIGGIASDDIKGSLMSVKDLGHTLGSLVSRYGKFDILATDACLMQMAAIAYEFKDYADILINSEQPIPGYGYPYLDIFSRLIEEGNSLDAAAVASLVVNMYKNQYMSYASTTLSALRANNLDTFSKMLNEWVEAVLSDRRSFEVIANNSKEFVRMTGMDASRDLVYIMAFIRQLEGVNPHIKELSTGIIKFVRERLILKQFASSTGFDFGLAIYLPDFVYNASEYETLKFASDTSWPIFVRAVINHRIKKAGR